MREVELADRYPALSHRQAMNWGAVNGRDSDHVEFRMFDASLEPGTIQTQVRTALGLADTALRKAALGETVAQSRSALGTQRGRFGARRLVEQEWEASTEPMRSLADEIFTSDEAKARLAEVFAQSRWQTPTTNPGPRARPSRVTAA